MVIVKFRGEMVPEWGPSQTATVFGWRAIRHRITKECTLVGQFGECFESSKGQATFSIWSSYCVSKMNEYLGLKKNLHPRSEVQFIVNDPEKIQGCIRLMKAINSTGKESWSANKQIKLLQRNL